jgi:hypothetical protein
MVSRQPRAKASMLYVCKNELVKMHKTIGGDGIYFYNPHQ